MESEGSSIPYYTPSAADAQFLGFSGVTLFDPGTIPPTPDPSFTDVVTYHWPVQNEILNLIQIAASGGVAITVVNHTGGTLNPGPISLSGRWDNVNNAWYCIASDATGPNPIACLFLLLTSLNNGAVRNVYASGTILGVNSGFDTHLATIGDPVYVAVGGGMTLTAPVNPNLVQSIGAVLTVANPGNVLGLVKPITVPAMGVSGFSGFSGMGQSGYSGSSGFSSLVVGPQGDSGLSGYSGASGAGASGYSGSSGGSGYSGYSATAGGPGSSGFSGFSGFNGTDGTGGGSGYSGYSGQSGYSGYTGYSGTAGTAPITSFVATGGASTGTTNVSQSVTGMSIALAGSTTYAFRVVAFISANGNGANAGLRATSSLSATALSWMIWGASYNGGSPSFDTIYDQQTSFLAGTVASGSSSSYVLVEIEGTIQTNHAGNLDLDLHPTTNGSSVSIAFGSYMTATKLA